MAKENKPIDWDGIERDYRAGVMSVREIAKWYGVSHTAINKRAKAEGWVREAQPKHFDRKALVGEIVSVQPAGDFKPEQLTDRARGLTARLLDELDVVTAHVGELEDMISEEESDPRRRGALMKAVSLGERAMTLKNLSLTMKTLTEAAAPAGKKEAKQAAAEEVGGKFGARTAPKLAVDNTK